jgi:hypothetical protein
MMLNDRTSLRILREKIDAALQPLVSDCGLTKLKAGHIRYEGDGLSAKITVLAESAASDGTSRDEREFLRYAPLFNLKPTDLHRKVVFAGKTYEIIGLRPNRRKYPVLCRNLNSNKIHLLKPEWIPADKNNGQQPN